MTRLGPVSIQGRCRLCLVKMGRQKPTGTFYITLFTICTQRITIFYYKQSPSDKSRQQLTTADTCVQFCQSYVPGQRMLEGLTDNERQPEISPGPHLHAQTHSVSKENNVCLFWRYAATVGIPTAKKQTSLPGVTVYCTDSTVISKRVNN